MKITLNSQVLRKLRTDRNIEISYLVRDLPFSEQDYEQLETEDSVIDSDLADKIASKFGRNWTVFLSKSLPVKPGQNVDTRLSQSNTRLHHKTIQTYEDAEDLLDLMVELDFPPMTELPKSVPNLTAVELADWFRQYLTKNDLVIPKKTNIRDYYLDWALLLEKMNINISHHSFVDDDGIRAFSITKSKNAVIVINNEENTEKSKLFSVLHELCHILMRKNTLCDFHRTDKIEAYCNAFASEILMPNQQFNELLHSAKYKDLPIEEKAKQLSRHFGASELAVYTRFLNKKLITKPQYDRYYQTAMEIVREKAHERRSIKSDGYNPFPVTRAQLGHLYTNRLFEAYHRQLISPILATKYFGFKKPSSIGKFKEWANKGYA